MTNNVKGLIVIRFMLGVVESAVMPSMLVFLRNWFTKHERSRATPSLYLVICDNSVDVNSFRYLVDALGWRWMFILEGFPAIIWAFFWWRLLLTTGPG
jgi:MFS family permease